ncbi:MAG: hypothetical protein AAF637_14620 [Pseudomonadota bacterium]
MLIRRLILLIGVLLVWTLPHPAHAERTEIHMFRYAGTNDDPAMGAFLDFRDIITHKLLLIAREVSSPDSATDRLRVTQVLDQAGAWAAFSADLSMLEGYWRDHGPLGVLLGRVRQRNDGFAVRSSMYLGALQGDLPQAFVDIDLPIADAQFDTTRDSHSVVTLYALAIGTLLDPASDTIDCDRSALGGQLLNEAYMRAQDVTRELPSLAFVEDAIEASLERLRQTCS